MSVSVPGWQQLTRPSFLFIVATGLADARWPPEGCKPEERKGDKEIHTHMSVRKELTFEDEQRFTESKARVALRTKSASTRCSKCSSVGVEWYTKSGKPVAWGKILQTDRKQSVDEVCAKTTPYCEMHIPALTKAVKARPADESIITDPKADKLYNIYKRRAMKETDPDLKRKWFALSSRFYLKSREAEEDTAWAAKQAEELVEGFPVTESWFGGTDDI